jgi:hypothetical protein
MLAGQGTRRDKSADVFFNIGAPDWGSCFVSLAVTLSQFLSVCPGAKPFLLTGWSIIFKPVFLSRLLLNQFRNQSAIFLSDNFLFFRASAYYTHSSFSVKGFFETCLFLFSRIRFNASVFVSAVFDSGVPIICTQAKESRGNCANLNYLRLKIRIP